MANGWFEIIDTILEEEGGYVNHPNDRGGETKYGITKARYPSLDIRSLSESEAKAIYHEDFWRRYRIEQRYPPFLQHQVMDMIVNHGSYTFGVILQRAINDYFKANIKVDGHVGPITLRAMDAGLSDGYLRHGFSYALRFWRIDMYDRIVKSRPKQKVFFLGWVRRALRVK